MIFEKQIQKLYQKQIFKRNDDIGCVFYFSAKDFEGLKQEPYAFTSKAGKRLQGYFYHYENFDPTRLVIFEHGMGGGHRSYMKEIERIAREGYLIYAYDHTGCMESEGETVNGFAQSLSDLDDCIRAIKSDEQWGGESISVVGHSWGGFATLNIPALHPDVTHIVAISGFISVEQILKQTFRGFMRWYFDAIFAVEAAANPDFVQYSARETFKNMTTKALVIHSDDDMIVKASDHFEVLRQDMIGMEENKIFMLTTKKGHNPNFTEEAAKYKDEFFADLTQKLKKKQLNTDEEKKAFVESYDWERMTAQDEAVWVQIFDFLAK